MVASDSKLPHLLTATDVERLTTLDRRTVTRGVALGRFPSPVQLPGTGRNGSRRVAWRGEDVQAWLDALQPAEVKAKQLGGSHD